MFVHFLVDIKNGSLVIVKVEVDKVTLFSMVYARRRAKEIIGKRFGSIDFEIKELTLPRLIACLEFEGGISHLIPFER